MSTDLIRYVGLTIGLLEWRKKIDYKKKLKNINNDF